MIRSGLALFALAMATSAAQAAPQLNAATLPNSRAVAVNAPATVFASVINSGDQTANNCRVGLGFGAANSLSVSYSPSSNGVINGAANTPVNIPANTTQQFVIAVTSSAAFNGNVPLTYTCDNASAVSSEGLNDLALRATNPAGPDIIAIAATLTNDGIMQTNANGRSVISIAAINIGAGDPPPDGLGAPSANEATINVSLQITNFSDGGRIPLTICPTNAQSICTAPFAQSIQVSIGDSAAFFKAAVQQIPGIGIPFYPGEYRLRIEFRDNQNNLVGATSVAPRSDPPAVQTNTPAGYWDIFVRDDSDPGSRFTREGRIFFPPDGSTPGGAIIRGEGQNRYLQPIVLIGQTRNSGGQDRFVGCMRFLNTGRGDAAHPGVDLVFRANHQLRGTYNSGSADACPPGDKPRGPDAPSIDPISSMGRVFGAYVDLAEDTDYDFRRAGGVDWELGSRFMGGGPAFGNVSMTPTPTAGEWALSGTMRDCSVSGIAVDYDLQETQQFSLKLTLTMSACQQSSPLSDGTFTGFLVVPNDPSPDNNIDATGMIFSDGFETGDTTRWSATIGD